jgi:hypothetical protein
MSKNEWYFVDDARARQRERLVNRLLVGIIALSITLGVTLAMVFA